MITIPEKPTASEKPTAPEKPMTPEKQAIPRKLNSSRKYNPSRKANFSRNSNSSRRYNSSRKANSSRKFNPSRKPNNKKGNKKLPKGVVHIQSTFNNTIITIRNLRGRVIASRSAGACGFKGARKSTPFAAKTAAEIAAKNSIDQGLRKAKVLVKGPGPGRETAIRGVIDAGLQITVIRDITGVPYNGCRPPKKRRV